MGDAPERSVRVSVQPRAGRVRVEVADTGPGIPPELHGRIFDPYFRGPNVHKSGIGLGLATVKRVVESHGGRVGVRSIVGQGSVFWFDLPQAAEHPSTRGAT
jgi:signal transduction histidine kinase